MSNSRSRSPKKNLAEIAEEQKKEAFSKGMIWAETIGSKIEINRFIDRYKTEFAIDSHLQSNRKEGDVPRELANVIMPSGRNRYHSSSDVFWDFAFGGVPLNDDCVRAFAKGILSALLLKSKSKAK